MILRVGGSSWNNTKPQARAYKQPSDISSPVQHLKQIRFGLQIAESSLIVRSQLAGVCLLVERTMPTGGRNKTPHQVFSRFELYELFMPPSTRRSMMSFGCFFEFISRSPLFDLRRAPRIPARLANFMVCKEPFYEMEYLSNLFAKQCRRSASRAKVSIFAKPLVCIPVTTTTARATVHLRTQLADIAQIPSAPDRILPRDDE